MPCLTSRVGAQCDGRGRLLAGESKLQAVSRSASHGELGTAVRRWNKGDAVFTPEESKREDAGAFGNKSEMAAIKTAGEAVVQEKESRAGEMVAGTMRRTQERDTHCSCVAAGGAATRSRVLGRWPTATAGWQRGINTGKVRHRLSKGVKGQGSTASGASNLRHVFLQSACVQVGRANNTTGSRFNFDLCGGSTGQSFGGGQRDPSTGR